MVLAARRLPVCPMARPSFVLCPLLLRVRRTMAAGHSYFNNFQLGTFCISFVPRLVSFLFYGVAKSGPV